jgi:endonuclease/exonuclease/phosphatase family metal-dependent hydrolase
MNFVAKKVYLVLVISFFLKLNAEAQTDTIRTMFYNLTNYGNIFGGCTNANNGISIKNPEFKTIMQYAKPDILGVCEMNTNPAVAGGFLSNVLNADGITYYARSTFVPEPSGTITSTLFYNSLKLNLHQQTTISTAYRQTFHFRLFLKTNGLANGDTIWLNVLVCHLKAGNTTADRTDRGNMTTTIRNYLNGFSKKENCIFMGDFNLYTNSETAIQNITSAGTNPTYQFLDPLNRMGSWTGNSSFADVHTQCPRTDNNGGCYSGGGLDDRFDFLFMNRHLLNDSANLKFVSGSYQALGNDGLHFNKSITASPTNNSVPAAVLNSLFKASDHLPVFAKIRVNGTFTSLKKAELEKWNPRILFQNERIFLEGDQLEKVKNISFAGFDGRQCPLRFLIENGQSIQILERISARLGILRVEKENGQIQNIKLAIP